MLGKLQGARIAQQHPHRDLRAAFFLEAVARAVPQRHTHALVPMRWRHINRPDFTHGRAGLGIARAVKADKADQLVAVRGHQHLRLAVFNRFAPVGLALFHRHLGEVVIGHQVFISGLPGGDMNFGNGFGIAGSGGTN